MKPEEMAFDDKRMVYGGFKRRRGHLGHRQQKRNGQERRLLA